MRPFEIILENIANSKNYEDYFEQFKKNSEINDFTSYSEDLAVKMKYTKLNFQRASRIHRTFKPSTRLIEAFANIDTKQTWVLLTEDWCGDSAQTVPYIYEFSKLSSNITFKIFQRDSNFVIMDLFLTNGTRSIPKLIVFDDSGEEIFQWGARPKEAQELVTKLKAEGKTKEEFTEQLHLWYGRNRGQNIEKEFIDLLQPYLIS